MHFNSDILKVNYGEIIYAADVNREKYQHAVDYILYYNP